MQERNDLRIRASKTTIPPPASLLIFEGAMWMDANLDMDVHESYLNVPDELFHHKLNAAYMRSDRRFPLTEDIISAWKWIQKEDGTIICNVGQALVKKAGWTDYDRYLSQWFNSLYSAPPQISGLE
jgi:hypothetical protein